MKRFVKRLFGLQPASPPQPRNKHLWSIGVYSGPSPTQLTDDRRMSNPVITREQVTDIPAAIVADPFLLHVGPTWYMFFEALNRSCGRGEIAVATSPDLSSWTYQLIVLREPFHISYPSVFEWMGDYYMVTETNQTRTFRLF
jgi:beta-xylosidase